MDEMNTSINSAEKSCVDTNEDMWCHLCIVTEEFAALLQTVEVLKLHGCCHGKTLTPPPSSSTSPFAPVRCFASPTISPDKPVIVEENAKRAVVQPADADLDADIVSFNVALRTKLLIGPISYNLADNPRYADAFSTNHWSPAERKRQRAEQRAARGSHSCGAQSNAGALRVAAAEAEVDSSEEEGALPMPLKVCTTCSGARLLFVGSRPQLTCPDTPVLVGVKNLGSQP